jgi:hypothetical protein
MFGLLSSLNNAMSVLVSGIASDMGALARVVAAERKSAAFGLYVVAHRAGNRRESKGFTGDQ